MFLYNNIIFLLAVITFTIHSKKHVITVNNRLLYGRLKCLAEPNRTD